MFRRAIAGCGLLVILSASTAAQTLYTAEMLRDLPTGDNLFALIESAQAEVTTDRFNSGGLNAGVRERASGFLASWSQARYEIGAVPISSPIDGTPMLFPELLWWDAIPVSPAVADGYTGAPDHAIGLSPHMPGGAWRGLLEGWGSGGALTQTSPSSRPPAVSQLGDYVHIAALASRRAMRNNVGFAVGAAFTRAKTVERRGERRQETRSLFLSVRHGLSTTRPLTVLALVQGDARHVQSIYELGKRWIAYGGYTDRSLNPAPLPPFFQADRIFDGPIPSLIDSTVTERRSVAGSRFTMLDGSRHQITGGLDLERTSASTTPIPAITIGERVDGVPARLWTFASPAVESHRHAWMITAFAADRLALGRHLTIHTALQFASADASARGAASGISWRTLLPSAHLEWHVESPLDLEVATGVSRRADQPLLGLLAYGDPNAPTADVFRWEGESMVAPLLMRVGPGTGGNPGFSGIDPQLKRPVTDEFFVRISSHPTPALRLRVTGLAGRQASLISPVNIGVPISGYTLFTIPDANADWVNPADDQQLPVYNRNRDTFGQDRYLLTNPEVEDATMGAIVVSAVVTTPRVVLHIGGTASASVGSGGNRGYTAIENDQSMLGELFTNPNAATYARGRLFNDRAYTIKTLSIVQLPYGMKIGAMARFQDGQPFSRLAIVPTLNQGAEAIQTFPRGRSRFSYRATLDVRLQKRVTIGPTQLDLIADSYNLLNAANEVEEYVVTGPRFREITAVQPPRAFHLGARVTF